MKSIFGNIFKVRFVTIFRILLYMLVINTCQCRPENNTTTPAPEDNTINPESKLVYQWKQLGTSAERTRKYIEKSKTNDEYDDFKKKKAEREKLKQQRLEEPIYKLRESEIIVDKAEIFQKFGIKAKQQPSNAGKYPDIAPVNIPNYCLRRPAPDKFLNSTPQTECLCIHHENVNKERAYLDRCNNECLIRCNFAENRKSESQYGVTNAHWNQKQMTMFTNPLQYWATKHSKVIACDNLDHGKETVLSYLYNVFSTIPKGIKQVQIWNDGPSSQFKNKDMAVVIQILEKIYRKKIFWNDHAADHAKSCVFFSKDGYAMFKF